MTGTLFLPTTATSQPPNERYRWDAGTVKWTGGRFYLEQGSTFLNQGGGVFDVMTDTQFAPSGTGPNRFVNEGVFRKSASNFAMAITVEFENRGQVDLLSGSLIFPNGFTSRGSFAVAQDAQLILGGGVFTLQTGYNFTGAGFYGVQSGPITIIGDLASPNAPTDQLCRADDRPSVMVYGD